MLMLPVAAIVADFRPGSYGDGWTWDDEAADLYGREPDRMAWIEARLRSGEPFPEPILLGDDGRIWDGHHRICAALRLGGDIMVSARQARGSL